jgi:hypothetical protein
MLTWYTDQKEFYSKNYWELVKYSRWCANRTAPIVYSDEFLQECFDAWYADKGPRAHASYDPARGNLQTYYRHIFCNSMPLYIHRLTRHDSVTGELPETYAIPPEDDAVLLRVDMVKFIRYLKENHVPFLRLKLILLAGLPTCTRHELADKHGVHYKYLCSIAGWLKDDLRLFLSR